MNWQNVERFKTMGEYRQAGKLAFELGYQADYGCHFGMRSGRDAAIAEFKAGWRDAELEAKRD